jgi:hypothetical protein
MAPGEGLVGGGGAEVRSVGRISWRPGAGLATPLLPPSVELAAGDGATTATGFVESGR